MSLHIPKTYFDSSDEITASELLPLDEWFTTVGSVVQHNNDPIMMGLTHSTFFDSNTRVLRYANNQLVDMGVPDVQDHNGPIAVGKFDNNVYMTRRVATGSGTGRMSVWNGGTSWTGEGIFNVFPDNASIRGFASLDSALVFATAQGTVHLWNPDDEWSDATVPGSLDGYGFTGATELDNGNVLLTATEDETDSDSPLKVFEFDGTTFELLFEYVPQDGASTTGLFNYQAVEHDGLYYGANGFVYDPATETLTDLWEGADPKPTRAWHVSKYDGIIAFTRSLQAEHTLWLYNTLTEQTVGPFDLETADTFSTSLVILDGKLRLNRNQFVLAFESGSWEIELYPESLLATDDHYRTFINGEEDNGRTTLIRDDETNTHQLVFDPPLSVLFNPESAVVFRETRADRPMIDFTPAARLPQRHIDLYYRQLLFILQELCNMSPIADLLGWPLSYGGIPLVTSGWTATFDDEDDGATEFALPDAVHSELIPHFMDIEVELASTAIDPTIPGTPLTRVASDPDEGEYVLDLDNSRITVDGDQNYGTTTKPIRISRQTKADDLFYRLKDWGGLSSTQIDGLVLQMKLLREETCGLPLMPDAHPLNNPLFPRALNFLQFVGPGKTFRFPWQGWIDPNVRIFIDDIEIFDYTIDWERFSLDLPFTLGDGQTATMHGGSGGAFPTVPLGIRTNEEDDGAPMWGPKPDIKGLVCPPDAECVEDGLVAEAQDCIEALQGSPTAEELAECNHNATQRLIDGDCSTPCGGGICHVYNEHRLNEFLKLFGLDTADEPTDLMPNEVGIRIGQTGTRDYLQANSTLTMPSLSGWAELDIPMTVKQFSRADGGVTRYVTIPNSLAPSCAGSDLIPGDGEIWIARTVINADGSIASSCGASNPETFFLTWCQAPDSGCAGFIPSTSNNLVRDLEFPTPCNPFLRYLWTAAQGDQLHEFKNGPAIQQFVSDVQGMSLTQIKSYLESGNAPQV